MMENIKKPVSIILSILMVLSLFTVIPIASASADTGSSYVDADSVETMIRHLPDYRDVTIEDKAAIEDAEAAYDALTDDQKSDVDNRYKLKLAAVSGALDAIEKDIADAAAAEAVAEQIRALPAAGAVTIDDKDAIEDAQAAFDALTLDQRALLSLQDRMHLITAKAALDLIEAEIAAVAKDAEDQAASDAVEALIEALPAAADVTLDDKDAIEEAQAAYDALTDDQKLLVTLNDRIKLVRVQAALDRVEQDAAADEKAAADEAAADEVEALIEALPALADITIEDKEAIEEAQAAYDALTRDQKLLVVLGDRMNLAMATAALNEIERQIAAAEKAAADEAAAKDVEDKILALPDADNVTIADKEAIEEVKAAYDALTPEQKQLVDLMARIDLNLSNAALNLIEDKIAAVDSMINNLPDAENVTVRNTDIINAARAAYDSLTDDEKAEISPETLQKLTDAEEALEHINEDIAAAQAVSDMINELPSVTSVTPSDKDAIDAAAAAYDELTDAQKSYVPLADKVKLAAEKGALDAAEKAVADEAAADEVEALIEALPDPADVTIEDKEAVAEVQEAYDALNRDQKLLINLADRVKLAADTALIESMERNLAAAQAVMDQIAALPEEITLDDAADIFDAIAAYNALTDAQEALVDEESVQKLNDAYDALADLVDAKIVETFLNNLPDAEDVTLRDKPVIDYARAAYEALNDDQKAQIPAETLQKLLDAEEALAPYLEDIAAAQAVSDMINELPSATSVTLNDKDAIDAAAAAYDELTDAQKNYVPLADKVKLAADKGALDAAEKLAADEAAADEVEALIEALPDPADVTIEDKDAVAEAQEAYDALTRDQKLLINLADRVKLAADTALIEIMERDLAAAQAVMDQIAALPEEITLDDAADIFAAIAAYNALTDAQEALVDEDSVQKLNDAFDALADLVDAKIVEAILNDLPDAEDVTLRDKPAIDNARAAYEALNDDQKAQIPAETLQKLLDAEEALAPFLEDIAAAQAVSDMINELPAANRVTVNDKDAIDAAAAAYDELTDAQKNYVPLADKVKLAADKGALDAAEKLAADEAASDAVEALIEALPDPADVTIEDKEAVAEAQEAYDALTRDQKLLVNLADRVKLAADNALIESMERDLAAAQAVKDQIDALPAAEDITLDDGADIADAIAAYNALTDDQKALIDDETVQKLKDARDAFIDHMVAEPVAAMINRLPEAEDVTTADAPFIEFVRAIYDSLDDDQKALIDDDTVKKLTDAEDALAKAIADQKAADDVEALIEALPAADDVTLDDKDDIEAARAAYDALTDDQKALIDDDTLKNLTDAEDALAKAADQKAADDVKDLIDALPAADDVTLDDKDDVEAARAAYDALTDDQKALIGDDTLKKLTDAEDKLNITVLLGDADGDGAVTVLDVTRIQRWLAGLCDMNGEDYTGAELTPIELKTADADGDGAVTVLDVTAIQRYLAGMEVDTPINQYV